MRRTIRYWSKCDTPRLAAALAYFALFSLAPTLVILIALAGLVVGQQNAEADALAPVRSFLGDTGAAALQSLVNGANSKAANVTALVIGILTGLVGAAGLFGQLKGALDAIWGSPPSPSRGVVGFVLDNLLSIAMVFGTGVLLLASLMLEVGTGALGIKNGALVGWINFGVTLLAASTLFAMVYKYLPPVRLTWPEALTGAAVTGVLFMGGQWLIGVYLGRVAIASGYGSAGPLVVILVWVYYSALTMLAGAAFTRAYSETRRQRSAG